MTTAVFWVVVTTTTLATAGEIPVDRVHSVFDIFQQIRTRLGSVRDSYSGCSNQTTAGRLKEIASALMPALADDRVHEGRFTQMCQLQSCDVALKNFERIARELTNINVYGGRSRTWFTRTLAAGAEKFDAAYNTMRSALGYPAVVDESYSQKGLALFRATHHETDKGPPPSVQENRNNSPSYTARVGDIVQISPAKIPINHFVKITKIEGEINGQPVDQFSEQAQELRRNALANKSGTMSFKITAQPSYDPNDNPPNDRQIEHFYTKDTTIQWKVTLDLATNKLQVSAVGANEQCNLDHGTVKTRPGSPLASPRLRSAFNSIECNIELNQALQDSMWKPFTASFLKDLSDPENPKLAEGLTPESCSFTTEKRLDGKVVLLTTEGSV